MSLAFEIPADGFRAAESGDEGEREYPGWEYRNLSKFRGKAKRAKNVEVLVLLKIREVFSIHSIRSRNINGRHKTFHPRKLFRHSTVNFPENIDLHIYSRYTKYLTEIAK